MLILVFVVFVGFPDVSLFGFLYCFRGFPEFCLMASMVLFVVPVFTPMLLEQSSNTVIKYSSKRVIEEQSDRIIEQQGNKVIEYQSLCVCVAKATSQPMRAVSPLNSFQCLLLRCCSSTALFLCYSITPLLLVYKHKETKTEGNPRKQIHQSKHKSRNANKTNQQTTRSIGNQPTTKNIGKTKKQSFSTIPEFQITKHQTLESTTTKKRQPSKILFCMFFSQFVFALLFVLAFLCVIFSKTFVLLAVSLNLV